MNPLPREHRRRTGRAVGHHAIPAEGPNERHAGELHGKPSPGPLTMYSGRRDDRDPHPVPYEEDRVLCGAGAVRSEKGKQ